MRCTKLPIIFVHGKGGVGKTTVSLSIARQLALQKKRTLWVTLEDPLYPEAVLREIEPSLFHLNCHFETAFAEYLSLKIKGSSLVQLFLNNKPMLALIRVAPGMREVVLLGKLWFERNHYDHIVVDMPSTGYGLALFQSTSNFAELFRGGPLFHDAQRMLDTFSDPNESGHVIVGIPEETPLRESIELRDHLKNLFPQNPTEFILNRVFPKVSGKRPSNGQMISEDPKQYALRRYYLEEENRKIWDEAQIEYAEVPYQILPEDDVSILKLSGNLL